MTMNEAQAFVAAEIEELARKHGIVCMPTPADELAVVLTRLSDDGVVPDRIEDLIVSLRRANVIDGAQMVTLLGRYLRAKHEGVLEKD